MIISRGIIENVNLHNFGTFMTPKLYLLEFSSIAETDLVELASSQWMLKTIFYRLMLTFASFVIGSTAEYEQSVSERRS